MQIKSAVFQQSSQELDQLPPPDKPEYAFIGRSNVGKSSLINMLCDHKGLAKTSGTPGKTRLINHFRIDESWYIVDLPGYGYARVSKEQRREFSALIYGYLEQRENLCNTFVLIDSRHEPKAVDTQFINWLGERGIAFSIVFTKIDKMSKQQFAKKLKHYQQELLKTWEMLPPIFNTSAEEKIGREEILDYIDSINEMYFEENAG